MDKFSGQEVKGSFGQRMQEIKSLFKNFADNPFRDEQKIALKFIGESTKKISVLAMPTGSGKSLTGMVAGASHPRFLYLCSSKILQRQLSHDFPEVEIMWGRNNFKCNLIPERTADSCIHSPERYYCPFRAKKDRPEECDYAINKNRVLASSFQVLNYHYFLFESNYVGRFSGYPIIICDEADSLESILAGFISLKFSKRVLDKLKIHEPKFKTATAKEGLSSWEAWAEESQDKIKRRLNRIFGSLETLDKQSDQYLWMMKEEAQLGTLLSRLKIFLAHMDKDWILEINTNYNKQVNWYEFKPTWLNPDLTKEFFFKHGEQFVFMSATFPPKKILSKIMGIEFTDMDYLELPSSFPISTRPLILKRSGDLSYKSYKSDLPGMLKSIEEIISNHPNEKGIIHTVSYKLNQAIMDIDDPRFITHSPKDKDKQLLKFYNSSNGVFVSPSSSRGLDLPYGKCRFAIIPKAPFQSLGDKLVNKRVYSSQIGNYWYIADMAQEVVQATGRANRYADDYCKTYILDNKLIDSIINQGSLYPKYWKDGIEI